MRAGSVGAYTLHNAPFALMRLSVYHGLSRLWIFSATVCLDGATKSTLKLLAWHNSLCYTRSTRGLFVVSVEPLHGCQRCRPRAS